VDEETAALLIASDEGEGFVTQKYAASHLGLPLLELVLGEAAAWPVDTTYVVLGADAEAVLDAADLGDAVVIIDPGWQEGLASGLRAGLDTLTRERIGRCVLGMGDQLGVVPGDVVAMLSAAEARDTAIVVPEYRYARSWPIVLTEGAYPRLLGIEGSVDVLELFRVHSEGVAEVHFDHMAPARIRGPQDLKPAGRG